MGSGVLAVVLLSRLIDGLLFEVEVTDPLTMLRVGGLLLAVSLAAAYLPARNAAWVPPSEALRAE